MPNLAMQSAPMKPRFNHSSGEWLCLVDTPPETIACASGDYDISKLLIFSYGEKQFEGFYCSNGAFGWVINTNASKAFYNIERIEYKHKKVKEAPCSL